MAPWPSPEGVPPRRVIITSNQTLAGESIGDVKAEAESYASWSFINLRTCVKTVEDIAANENYAAADLEDSIQLFVHDAIAQWGTEFFLLAGDLDVIPTRRLGAPDLDDHPRLDPLADIYYVMGELDWNEDDDGWIWEDDDDVADFGIRLGMPQASVGRLPIRGYLDADRMFQKLRNYQDPQQGQAPDADWYESVLLAAGPLLSMNPNHAACGYKIAEEIRVEFSTAVGNRPRNQAPLCGSVRPLGDL
jgi:hypothetical protein